MDDDYEVFMMDLDERLPSRRLRRADFFVVGIGLFYRLSNAITSTLEEAHDFVAMHANYEVDRDAFQEEAALEIEMLVANTEEEDG